MFNIFFVCSVFGTLKSTLDSELQVHEKIFSKNVKTTTNYLPIRRNSCMQRFLKKKYS